MRPHCTTTLERICQLYEAERQPLESEHGWADQGVAQALSDIRASLAELWPKERAERVFASEGPPRLISDGRPMPQGRGGHARLPAYGIAPLPSGGD